MRVRLYELGKRSVGVVLIDDFPASLAVDEEGRLHSGRAAGGVCHLEDLGGQLVLRSRGGCREIAVNNAPLEEGPLMPGDRLDLMGHQYVVSYEQVSPNTTCPTRYRIEI